MKQKCRCTVIFQLPSELLKDEEMYEFLERRIACQRTEIEELKAKLAAGKVFQVWPNIIISLNKSASKVNIYNHVTLYLHL